MNASLGKIVIAGGSGFLGQNLAHALKDRASEVVLLSRNAPKTPGPWRHVSWDGRTVGPWVEELENAAGLFNVAGRTVDCIKTPDHCDEILRSRVESVTVLGEALRTISTPPPVWVQMSTAHIYGDPPQGIVCDENSAFGYGLAPDVGRAWEAAYAAAVLPEMRQVITRTSFVLGRDAGALPRLTKLARWGFGGTLGHGRQGMSWIHEDDMNRILIRALTDPNMQGPYIVTAPNPVSNKEFMRELRHACGARIGLPATEWMVRIGAPLTLKTDPNLAIYGRYCIPKRLTDEGFTFTFPDLPSAMTNLFT